MTSSHAPGIPKNPQEQKEAEKREFEKKRDEALRQAAAVELDWHDRNKHPQRLDEKDADAPRYSSAVEGQGAITVDPADKTIYAKKLAEGDYLIPGYPNIVVRIKGDGAYPVPFIKLSKVLPNNEEQFKEAYRAVIATLYSQGSRTLNINYGHTVDVDVREVRIIMSLLEERGMKATFGDKVEKVFGWMPPEQKVEFDNYRQSLDELYRLKNPERDGAERAVVFENQTNELNNNKKWQDEYATIATIPAENAGKEKEFLKQLLKDTSPGAEPNVELKGEKRIKKLEEELTKIESRTTKLEEIKNGLEEYQRNLTDSLDRFDNNQREPIDSMTLQELIAEDKEAIKRITKDLKDPGKSPDEKNRLRENKEGVEKQLASRQASLKELDLDLKLKTETDPLKIKQYQEEKRLLSLNLDHDKIVKSEKKCHEDRGKLIKGAEAEITDLSERREIIKDKLRELKSVATAENKSDEVASINQLLDRIEKPGVKDSLAARHHVLHDAMWGKTDAATQESIPGIKTRDTAITERLNTPLAAPVSQFNRSL